MAQLFSMIKKQYIMIILLLFTLSSFLVLQYALYHPENDAMNIPFSLVRVTNDKVPKNTNRSWLDYSKNWDGEILVINHPEQTTVTLTDNYRMKMKSKGLHPLNLKYKRLRDRMERIDEYCDSSLSGRNAVYKMAGYYSMLFHDKSQLLQCLVPKVGSSSWVTVFSKLVGLKIKTPFDEKDIFWHTVTLNFNMNDNRLIAQRFQTYTKFMFSRQPFQRLLSAHIDKFHNQQSWYEETFAPQIITANYLSNYSKSFISETRKKLKSGVMIDSSSEVVRQISRLDAGFQKYNITFLEFLKYIVFFSKTDSLHNLNAHWRPISLLCNVCAVKYDIIGKIDTLSEDSQAILDFVHPNIPEFVYEFPKATPKITNSTCDEAFRKIPPEVRRSLYDVYKNDFILFDYVYNEDESANLC